ncbi:MAG: hypothetical protein AAF617_03680 [Bacteroidota bacterium]
MNEKKLVEIIHHYKQHRAAHPETWLLHCAQQNSLEEAIYEAATARNHEGKKNKHQWRLKNIDLEKFAVQLVDKADEIRKCTSFDELLDKVQRYKINGIGILTVYDTAERIGAYLDVYPDKIYLHAGVKVGAEKVLGMPLNKEFIHKEDLPEAFQQPDLHCGAIEDILCMYKDSFDDENESFIPKFFPHSGFKKKKSSC